MIKYLNYNIVFREIPDKISLALNITNCQNKCIGCHSSYLQQDIGTELTNIEFNRLLDKYGDVDCILFMGEGNDKDRLIELAKIVKNKNLLVALYSGSNFIDKDYVCIFDYIKIGEYIAELGGLECKGTNQKLYKVKDNNLVDITHLIS